MWSNLGWDTQSGSSDLNLHPRHQQWDLSERHTHQVGDEKGKYKKYVFQSPWKRGRNVPVLEGVEQILRQNLSLYFTQKSWWTLEPVLDFLFSRDYLLFPPQISSPVSHRGWSSSTSNLLPLVPLICLFLLIVLSFLPFCSLLLGFLSPCRYSILETLWRHLTRVPTVCPLWNYCCTSLAWWHLLRPCLYHHLTEYHYRCGFFSKIQNQRQQHNICMGWNN